MTDYLRGLDAATVLTPYAKTIADHGFSAAGRYLKSLTRPEIEALHGAGLGLWLIYESTPARALGGFAAGQQDGDKARIQAVALGVPPEVAIFLTVDTDVSAPQIEPVSQYHIGFQTGANPRACGSYSCGAVQLAVAKMAKPPIAWLAGAMGWNGSKAYDATAAWSMKQGPQINAGHTANWAGLSWPALSFAYDPNLIVVGADVGFWMPSGTQIPAPPATPAAPVLVVIPSALDLQRALQAAGFYKGTLDGDKPNGWGPLSQAALAAYYASK